MTKTLEEAREALDESMSVLALATDSLSTICDALLEGGQKDENNRVLIGQGNRNAITWLASHVHELTQQHIKLWDRLDDLIREKSDAPV